MKKISVMALACGLALTAGVSFAGEAKPASSLDDLMAVVGQQLEVAGKELKAFLAKANKEMVAKAIDMGAKEMADQLEATPEQRTAIEPVLQQELEGAGLILNQAVTVGMAAAQASVANGIDLQWRGVRAELAETLDEAQLEKADNLHRELREKLVALFETTGEEN